MHGLAYMGNGWNENENLVTVWSTSFQYKQRKLKMIITPGYFAVRSANIKT